jgi:UPF0755 protein
MNLNKKISLAIVIILIAIGGLFYFRNEVYYSHGSYAGQKTFTISQGEGNAEIAGRLAAEGLISGKYYFYYYIRTHGLLNKIMPGDYQLSGSLTIPEIAHIITNVQEKFVKITFPEGFAAAQMAARLTASGLPGEQFLQIVDNPADLKSRYGYLNNAKTLEGYLFPDTYFFKPDVSAQEIALHLLDNFDSKLDSQMRVDIAKNNRSIADTVTLASIVQKEVQSPSDMQIVAGIFWKRLANSQRLQSDATLSYILKDKIDSHSGAALATDSPYNTYLYAGLPPGPIGNPGLDALNAAIYPVASDYNYFLTATVNGQKQVFFSATYDQQVANKAKYGVQ